MNEFQQQILQKIEQIALKMENYKTSNQELTKLKEELEAKVHYLEKREQELNDQLDRQQMELSEKSELIDKATTKIEDLLGSIDISGPQESSERVGKRSMNIRCLKLDRSPKPLPGFCWQIRCSKERLS